MITSYEKNAIEIDHETLIPRWAITQVYPENKPILQYWICYDQDQIPITPEEREKIKGWLNESPLMFPLIWGA